MKTNRSLAEALSTAKQLRRESEEPTAEVVSKGARARAVLITATDQTKPTPPEKSASTWVRHTVGLRAETSLKLRDAADAQKRKARHGMLQPEDPANEQEISDLGVRLALHRLRLD